MTHKSIQKRDTPPRPVATVRIHNLRLRTYIGFNPEERTKKQDVVINIEIDYLARTGVLQDCVDDVLNYKSVTKSVIRLVEENRFLLLEKLVADVLAACSEHPDVVRSRVTIDKPHALRFADSVSLSLEYRADEAAELRILEKAS
jgi:D-erythro-7,8-dihydroneopterin triphosphate epimerase